MSTKLKLKSPLGPVRPVKLGTWSLTGTNPLQDGLNHIPLSNLPNRNAYGVAMLVALERKLSVTYHTAASDPTVPSYMLDGPFEEQLISNDSREWIHNLGYFMPIREYDRSGWLRGTDIAADLTAAGGGGSSQARTIIRRTEFLMPAFGPMKYMNLKPCRYFSSGGSYDLTINLGPVYLNGATVTITALELEMTAYCADWLDLTAFPIPMYIRERFKRGDRDEQPSCGPGMFLDWFLAIDPAGTDATDSATPNDDLSDITRISVTVSNGGTPLFDRYVDEQFRRYLLNSRDEQDTIKATGYARQEQYRFPDAVHNTSNRMHYLPVISHPRVGATFKHIVNFGTTGDPRILINAGDRTGVPEAFTHVLTEVSARDDKMVEEILASIGAAKKFSGKSQKDFQTVPGVAQYVPLSIDLT